VARLLKGIFDPRVRTEKVRREATSKKKANERDRNRTCMLFSRKSQLENRMIEPDPFICAFRRISSLFSVHELNHRRSCHVSVVAQTKNLRRHIKWFPDWASSPLQPQGYMYTRLGTSDLYGPSCIGVAKKKGCPECQHVSRLLLFLLLMFLRSICDQVSNQADIFVLLAIFILFSRRFAHLLK